MAGLNPEIRRTEDTQELSKPSVENNILKLKDQNILNTSDARSLSCNSGLSLSNLITESVNSSISLDEDNVNFTFSFPRSYFSKLSLAVLNEIKGVEFLRIEDNSNTPEMNDRLKSLRAPNSSCTDTQPAEDQDIADYATTRVVSDLPKQPSLNIDSESQNNLHILDKRCETSLIFEDSTNMKSFNGRNGKQRKSINSKLIDGSTSTNAIANKVAKENSNTRSEKSSWNLEFADESFEFSFNEDTRSSEQTENSKASASCENECKIADKENGAPRNEERLDSRQKQNVKIAAPRDSTCSSCTYKDNLSTEGLNYAENSVNKNLEFDAGLVVCSNDASQMNTIIQSGESASTNKEKNIDFSHFDNTSIHAENEISDSWGQIFPFQEFEILHTKEINVETSGSETKKYFEFKTGKDHIAIKVTSKNLTLEVVKLRKIETKRTIVPAEDERGTDSLEALVIPEHNANPLSKNSVPECTNAEEVYVDKATSNCASETRLGISTVLESFDNLGVALLENFAHLQERVENLEDSSNLADDDIEKISGSTFEGERLENAGDVTEDEASIENAGDMAEDEASIENAGDMAEDEANIENDDDVAEDESECENCGSMAEEEADIKNAGNMAEDEADIENAGNMAEDEADIENAGNMAEDEVDIENAGNMAEDKADIENAGNMAEDEADIENAGDMAEDEADIKSAGDMAEDDADIEIAGDAAEDEADIGISGNMAESEADIETDGNISDDEDIDSDMVKGEMDLYISNVTAEDEMDPEVASDLAEDEMDPEVAGDLAEDEIDPGVAGDLPEDEIDPEVAGNLPEDEIDPEVAGNLAEDEIDPEVAGDLAENEMDNGVAGDLAEDEMDNGVAGNLAEDEMGPEVAGDLAEDEMDPEVASNLAEDEMDPEISGDLVEDEMDPKISDDFVEDIMNIKISDELAEDEMNIKIADELTEDKIDPETADDLEVNEMDPEINGDLTEDEMALKIAGDLVEDEIDRESAGDLAEDKMDPESAGKLTENQTDPEIAGNLGECEMNPEIASKLAEGEVDPKVAGDLAEAEMEPGICSVTADEVEPNIDSDMAEEKVDSKSPKDIPKLQEATKNPVHVSKFETIPDMINNLSESGSENHSECIDDFDEGETVTQSADCVSYKEIGKMRTGDLPEDDNLKITENIAYVPERSRNIIKGKNETKCLNNFSGCEVVHERSGDPLESKHLNEISANSPEKYVASENLELTNSAKDPDGVNDFFKNEANPEIMIYLPEGETGPKRINRQESKCDPELVDYLDKFESNLESTNDLTESETDPEGVADFPKSKAVSESVNFSEDGTIAKNAGCPQMNICDLAKLDNLSADVVQVKVTLSETKEITKIAKEFPDANTILYENSLAECKAPTQQIAELHGVKVINSFSSVSDKESMLKHSGNPIQKDSAFKRSDLSEGKTLPEKYNYQPENKGSSDFLKKKTSPKLTKNLQDRHSVIEHIDDLSNNNITTRSERLPYCKTVLEGAEELFENDNISKLVENLAENVTASSHKKSAQTDKNVTGNKDVSKVIDVPKSIHVAGENLSENETVPCVREGETASKYGDQSENKTAPDCIEDPLKSSKTFVECSVKPLKSVNSLLEDESIIEDVDESCKNKFLAKEASKLPKIEAVSKTDCALCVDETVPKNRNSLEKTELQYAKSNFTNIGKTQNIFQNQSRCTTRISDISDKEEVNNLSQHLANAMNKCSGIEKDAQNTRNKSKVSNTSNDGNFPLSNGSEVGKYFSEKALSIEKINEIEEGGTFEHLIKDLESGSEREKDSEIFRITANSEKHSYFLPPDSSISKDIKDGASPDSNKSKDIEDSASPDSNKSNYIEDSTSPNSSKSKDIEDSTSLDSTKSKDIEDSEEEYYELYKVSRLEHQSSNGMRIDGMPLSGKTEKISIDKDNSNDSQTSNDGMNSSINFENCFPKSKSMKHESNSQSKTKSQNETIKHKSNVKKMMETENGSSQKNQNASYISKKIEKASITRETRGKVGAKVSTNVTHDVTDAAPTRRRTKRSPVPVSTQMTAATDICSVTTRAKHKPDRTVSKSPDISSEEVDTSSTLPRTKHYPAPSLSKDIIPENSEVSKTVKTRIKPRKDNSNPNTSDSSANSSPVKRPLHIKSLSTQLSTSLEQDAAQSEKSSNEKGARVNRKRAQTPDTVKERVTIAVRSSPRKTAVKSYRLNRSQAVESEEATTSTPKKNIRPSNQSTSEVKVAKGKPTSSASTVSCSTRSRRGAKD